MNPRIIVEKVDELPSNIGWDYSMLDLDHLLEQVEDGDRANNSTVYMYERRLYERQGDFDPQSNESINENDLRKKIIDIFGSNLFESPLVIEGLVLDAVDEYLKKEKRKD